MSLFVFPIVAALLISNLSFAQTVVIPTSSEGEISSQLKEQGLEAEAKKEEDKKWKVMIPTTSAGKIEKKMRLKKKNRMAISVDGKTKKSIKWLTSGKDDGRAPIKIPSAAQVDSLRRVEIKEVELKPGNDSHKNHSDQH